MRRDPLEARLRLRQLLQRPFGEAAFDGEDLRAVLDELDRLLRYRAAAADPAPAAPVGPAPRPQNFIVAERLAAELRQPPGAGRLTRRQLLGLLDDWRRLMRLEAYMQHLPTCPLHSPDPWSPSGYRSLYEARPHCTCGFHLAYLDAPAPASPPPPKP